MVKRKPGKPGGSDPRPNRPNKKKPTGPKGGVTPRPSPPRKK